MSWDQSVKRRVFVSYQHSNDQNYYDTFSHKFCGSYDVISDNSLERRIDSDDVEYVMRRIRENHLTGSSCTIVLVGANTWRRKYVDWEIDATLQKEHGLIGLKLPTLPIVDDGCSKPARLQDNIDSGYALWAWWEAIIDRPTALADLIESANAKPKNLVNNTRARCIRNM